MSDFEISLNDLDARLETMQSAAKALAAAIGRTRKAADVGRVAEIGKGLSLIAQRVAETEAAGEALGDGWSFDAAAYLADGRFLTDLTAAAAELGLRLFEQDGRIYCFPLLLRIDAKELAVRIGKTAERRIRPRELARTLAQAQKRPQRFREEQFLELLYNAWRRLAGADWRELGAGPIVALSEIHETLTLMPGSDYPAEEFARDLLLLDRRADLRTRGGFRVEFPASTLSKGRIKRLSVYDEDGGEHVYIGVRFVKDS